MTHIKVGKPDVAPDALAHVPGVRQGNSKGSYARSPGHREDETSTSRRSTGVSPGAHNAILPEMPNLSPA